MERWSQKMNMGKLWSRGDLMSRSDYTGLRTKRLLASWLNKSSQNLSLFSYIYNAFELLARLLEEWSSVTRLWVEKIWSSVTGSGYISIRQISVDTWEYWTRWYWSLALEGLKQARLLSVELRKLLALQVHHHVLISGRWGTIKSTN